MIEQVLGFTFFLAAFSINVFAADAMPVASTDAMPVAPKYALEECCAICPEARDPKNYEDSFLSKFKILLEGKNNWLFRSENDFLEQFGPTEAGYAELKRLNEALKAKGVTLVLVYTPTRGLLHSDLLTEAQTQHFHIEKAKKNFRLTLNKMRAQGIVVPDLTELFSTNHPASTDHPDFFFKRDHHWTTYGAEITAQIVSAEIKKLAVYQTIPKVSYSTRQEGLITKSGTLQAAYKKICGYDTSDQYIKAFVTESSGASSGESSDLFGDSFPEITLVGTSNSKGALSYNFDGFLKQHLSADLNNVALPAGFDGALLQYLPSDDFQKSPPKIMIWEVPSYYDLENDMFYRQAIPLINNGCKGKKTLLEKTTLITSDIQEVLFNGGGKVLPIKGTKHVIDLTFSDPNIKQLDANVWMMNGRKDRIKAKFSERVNNSGRFVFEIKRDGEWAEMNFLSLDITRLESYGKSVQVKTSLCEME